MLIDTHCHLDFKEFDLDREAVVKRAREAGVGYIINVGSSVEGSKESVNLALQYESVYATIGVHPHHTEQVNPSTLKSLKELALAEKVVGIGEIGLDYYKNPLPPEQQRESFRLLINLARDLNLPLIIHNREAHQDILAILEEELTPPLLGVIHCFSGDENFLNACLSLGLFISFTCNITFKKSDGLRRLAKLLPLERLLLETDAPFLAPQTFRGRRNEPAYIRFLVEELATLKGVSFGDIASVTSDNALNLFRFKKKRPTIAYHIRDSLYLNITNRCTNSCTFCVRLYSDFVKGYNLRLKREPTVEEIIDAVGNPKKFREIVFCGYGEPLLRLDAVLEVSRRLKQKGAYIRLNTNGQGNLIHNRSIAGELVGLIDEVSVSLNAESLDKYNQICHPKFGREAFSKIKEFILECKRLIGKVSVTCIDLPEVDIRECERIAREELGVGFRVRKLGIVG